MAMLVIGLAIALVCMVSVAHPASDDASGRALPEAGLGALAPRGTPGETDSPPARRVITLAPHATELVFAAGGGERLVGVARYSDWPSAARALPRVGDAWHLNAETLVSLRPDLVVAWLPGPVQAVQAALDAAHIPVLYSAPTRLADIPADIERLGERLDTAATAVPAARALRERLQTLQATYAGREPVRVFIHAGSHPLYTLSDAHVVADALRLCGGHNVFGAAGPAAPQVELESLIAARPQVILTTDDQAGSDPLAFWRSVAPHLPAVREHRVIVLPADALYRPGPRLIDATQQLCEALDVVRQAPDARP